jgi:hypothetical protein
VHHGASACAVVSFCYSIKVESDNGDGAGSLNGGNKMKRATMILVIGFALAPFAARATTQHHYARHHAPRHAIPMTATASVPAVKVDDNSDGLSRNREDCNRGCIDN